MKHCKKLVAVLLAAVMLLSMLTACGGSGNSYEQAAERVLLNMFSKAFNVSANNTLRSEADQVLRQVGAGGVISGNGQLTWGEEKVAVVLGNSSTGKATAFPLNAGELVLTNEQEAALKAMGSYMEYYYTKYGMRITEVGVAVKEIDGQLYAAIALKAKKI